MAGDPYRVDPDDPRAPPQELWDRLTPEERARIVATLERMVKGVEQRRTELEQQLAEEAQLRVEETQRREEAERRLAEALAELERLRGSQR